MLLALVKVLAICSLNSVSPPPSIFPSDSLRDLYDHGRTWQEFLDAARSRRDMWSDNWAHSEPLAELVARAKAVGGSWRILAVAEDWCGDSANTIPYIARLVEQVPSLELRIVNSTLGRWVMEAHRTPDGRAATPTVLLLSSAMDEQGCFVERPAGLRAWVAENKPKLSEDDFQAKKMAWYKNDRGKETVRELVEMMESAAAGSAKCDGGH